MFNGVIFVGSFCRDGSAYTYGFVYCLLCVVLPVLSVCKGDFISFCWGVCCCVGRCVWFVKWLLYGGDCKGVPELLGSVEGANVLSPYHLGVLVPRSQTGGTGAGGHLATGKGFVNDTTLGVDHEVLGDQGLAVEGKVVSQFPQFNGQGTVPYLVAVRTRFHTLSTRTDAGFLQ